MDDSYLNIIVCPACKSKLVKQPDALVCTKDDCRRHYPIRDGIPIMLIDESQVLSESEHRQIIDPST